MSSDEARRFLRDYYRKLAATATPDDLRRLVAELGNSLATHMDWYDVIRLAGELQGRMK